MILLILGWHLTLLGAITIILGFIYSSWMIFVGLGALAGGTLLSTIYRNACSGYRSDPPNKSESNVPLDYY
jgi:hypothetical protein